MYLGSEETLLLQMGSVPSQRTWESRLPLFHHCEWVSSFPVALTEHHDQKKRGEERLIPFYALQFIIRGSQGRNPEPGPEGETLEESVYGLLSKLTFSYLSYTSRYLPWVALPMVVWVLPTNH